MTSGCLLPQTGTSHLDIYAESSPHWENLQMGNSPCLIDCEGKASYPSERAMLLVRIVSIVNLLEHFGRKEDGCTGNCN
jgi:hypothetical protein